MDVKELREQCHGHLSGKDWPIKSAAICDVLRILDAFGAMESRGWQLLRTEVDDGAWLWQVIGSEGETLAWSETLLDVVVGAYTNAEDNSGG